jgi:hypothetical protein
MRHISLLGLLIVACALACPVRAAIPVINQQPGNLSVVENQSATFSVGATGDALLYYQWRRNGSILSNAPNNRFYNIPFAQLADDGDGFSVIITNSSGSATSTVATLTVSADLTPPTILLVTNTPDFSQLKIVFSERVDAAAGETFNYSMPGVNIVDAIRAPNGSNVTLIVEPGLLNGNFYSLNVSGISDLAATPNMIDPATHYDFQAGNPPVIISHPQSQTVSPGGSTSFAVTASGSALEYRWYRGLSQLPGQTSNTLSLASIQPSMLGSYRVVVSNYLGVATSEVATLSFVGSYTVDLPVGFSFVTKHLSNSSPQFPVPPSEMTLYKWNPGSGIFTAYDFVPGLGWSPVEPIVNVGEGVVVQSFVPASLIFTGTRINPVLPVQLQPGLNLLGAQVPISASYVDIVGPPQPGSVVYQYRPGGDPQIFSEDNYRINYFINGFWHDQPPRLKVGEAAWVKVSAPVVITNQPVGLLNAPIGQSASFFVGATGEVPLRYQWRLNGQDIPNGTNALYFINSVAPSNAGIYSVTVGNLLGDINSTNVPLKLNVAGFPLTDDFGAQNAVSDSNRLLSSHNRKATTQPGEPQHAGKRTRASVWLTWIAPTTGIVNMSVAGSDFDAVLAVYTGNSVSNLALLDANDDDAGYGCGRVRFNARAGISYRICVAGLGDSEGDILLGWNLEPTTDVLPEFEKPPRDLTVGYGGTAQFTATVTNGVANYQWFHDGVPVSNNVTADKATLIIPNVSDADVGRYFVRVQNQKRNRDSERAELQIQVPAPPAPIDGLISVDKLFDLDLLGGGGQLFKGPVPKFGVVHHGYSLANPGMSVSSYARAAGEPNHCGIAGGSTVWFTVQAETNGTLYVNTDNSTYNTLLAAYVGPGDSYLTLTNVGCDNNSGLDGLDSRMNFPVTTGKQYFIAAGGVGSSSGTLRWKYQLVRPLTITNVFYTNISGGRITMRIDGTPGLAATVQSATNLSTPAWTTLTNYTAVSGSFNFTNNNVGAINRYYRVVNIF